MYQAQKAEASSDDSDEEADLRPHCLQGYGESTGSESDLPDPHAADVYGNVCDFD